MESRTLFKRVNKEFTSYVINVTIKAYMWIICHTETMLLHSTQFQKHET